MGLVGDSVDIAVEYGEENYEKNMHLRELFTGCPA